MQRSISYEDPLNYEHQVGVSNKKHYEEEIHVQNRDLEGGLLSKHFKKQCGVF